MIDFVGFIKNRFNFRRKLKVGLLDNVLTGSEFEGNNYIGKFSTFKGSMGLYSYIGDHSIVFAKIGRFTSIAGNVHVLNGSHPYHTPFVSTSPVFYAPDNVLGVSFVTESKYVEYKYADKNNKYPVVIGNDCWIGAEASLVEGVNIGDGGVVLARALVTKDVPPYAIVGGVPAKILGYRYEMETVEKLQESRWWEHDVEWIQKHSALFCDISKFINVK